MRTPKRPKSFLAAKGFLVLVGLLFALSPVASQAATLTIQNVNDSYEIALADATVGNTQASGIVISPSLSGTASQSVTLRASLSGQTSNLKISSGASLVYSPTDVKNGVKKSITVSISGALKAGQTATLSLSGSGITAKTTTVSAVAPGTPASAGNPATVTPVPTLPNNPISLDQLMTNVLKNVFIGLGLVAFLALVWSGILYITAGGDTAKAEKARKSIMFTLIGVILAILAFSIVSYVTKAVSTLNSGAGSPTTNTGTGKTNTPSGNSTPSGASGNSGGATGSTGATGTTGSTGGATTNQPAGLVIADDARTLQNGVVTITNPGQSFNNAYGVTLAKAPTNSVTVTVSQSGDLPISISTTTLGPYTTTNYQPNDQGFNVRYFGTGKSGQSTIITLTGSDGSVSTIKFVIQ